jgi:peptidoglycan/LPS O-acetylase OafA/YrhL
MKVLEGFERAWRSQDHRKKGNLATEIQALLMQLETERKRNRIVLTTCGAYTLMSIVGIGILSGTRELVVEEVWPALAAQVFALVVLAVALRAQFSRNRPADATGSIRELTRCGLRQTQSSMRTLRLLAVAMVVMVGFLGLAMASLAESGKMDARAIRSMTGLLVVIIAVNAMLMLWKWRRRLQPRRDRLEQIMRDMNG